MKQVFEKRDGRHFPNRKKKNKANMIKGYREMARINTELAQLFETAEYEEYRAYENQLSECEERDSEKRGHLLR